MISHNEGTFISSFQRKTDHTGSRGRLCNELHPRPPFTQSRNATMNQARQIRAGTCDTKDAHINAEKQRRHGQAAGPGGWIRPLQVQKKRIGFYGSAIIE